MASEDRQTTLHILKTPRAIDSRRFPGDLPKTDPLPGGSARDRSHATRSLCAEHRAAHIHRGADRFSR